MWPSLPFLSATTITPNFPPVIQTSSVELGSVICATPERKATSLVPILILSKVIWEKQRYVKRTDRRERTGLPAHDASPHQISAATP